MSPEFANALARELDEIASGMYEVNAGLDRLLDGDAE